MISKLITYFAQRSADQAKNALDRSFGYPEVVKVAQLLKNLEYEKVTKVYKTLSHDQRTALIEGICLTPKNVPAIQEWVTHFPECAVANLFNGALWTYTAWEARTGYRAKHISETQASTFFEHLDQAYQHLSFSIELNPDDPEPYARMIRVLMGLSEPLDALFEYYYQMIRLEPEHLYGHLYLLNALSAKWLGSDAEMMQFAHRVCDGLAEGSLVYTLLPMAHIEIWLNHYQSEQEGVLANYFHLEPVQEEMYHAYERSVLSATFQDSQLKPVIHNYFCFVFHWMGKNRLAAAERNSFGKHMSFYPWAYEGVLTLKEVDAYLSK